MSVEYERELERESEFKYVCNNFNKYMPRELMVYSRDWIELMMHLIDRDVSLSSNDISLYADSLYSPLN